MSSIVDINKDQRKYQLWCEQHNSKEYINYIIIIIRLFWKQAGAELYQAMINHIQCGRVRKCGGPRFSPWRPAPHEENP